MPSAAPAARVAFVVEAIPGLQRLQREMARSSQRDENYESKKRALQAAIQELRKMVRVSKAQQALCTTWHCKQQQEEPMSKQHSATKRHRRPKSEKRTDYTARTMAAVKQLEQAAKLKVK